MQSSSSELDSFTARQSRHKFQFSSPATSDIWPEIWLHRVLKRLEHFRVTFELQLKFSLFWLFNHLDLSFSYHCKFLPCSRKRKCVRNEIPSPFPQNIAKLNTLKVNSWGFGHGMREMWQVYPGSVLNRETGKRTPPSHDRRGLAVLQLVFEMFKNWTTSSCICKIHQSKTSKRSCRIALDKMRRPGLLKKPVAMLLPWKLEQPERIDRQALVCSVSDRTFLLGIEEVEGQSVPGPVLHTACKADVSVRAVREKTGNYLSGTTDPDGVPPVTVLRG